MVSLADVIGAADSGLVESKVFGTTDAAEIASVLSSLAAAGAGGRVRDGLWYQSSVAAVAALRLDDDRRVVVHAYRPDVTASFIDGVVRVQRHLVSAGIPSARPLSGPVSAHGVLGRVESLRPDPGPRRFAPHEMPVSAHGLARLARCSGSSAVRTRLHRSMRTRHHTRNDHRTRVWPPRHPRPPLPPHQNRLSPALWDTPGGAGDAKRWPLRHLFQWLRAPRTPRTATTSRTSSAGTPLFPATSFPAPEPQS